MRKIYESKVSKKHYSLLGEWCGIIYLSCIEDQTEKTVSPVEFENGYTQW